ncbi:MAG: hypothetical protein R3C12_00300 [Planctomycetaceae bacterium]
MAARASRQGLVMMAAGCSFPSLRVLAMNLTETRGIVNLLLLLLLIEATVVGTLVARRMRQPPPPMPAAEWLDPLSREDLAELARLAQSDRAEDLLTLGNALLGRAFIVMRNSAFNA